MASALTTKLPCQHDSNFWIPEFFTLDFTVNPILYNVLEYYLVLYYFSKLRLLVLLICHDERYLHLLRFMEKL